MIPEMKLTSAGAALLAKVPEGQTAQVTRWQIGTGALPPGSSLDRTALVEPLKYLSLSSVERRGNTASVLGQFVNTGMSAFVWEELGLWASDPEEGEVLMCYGNALGAGEAIQAGSENLREFIFGTELIFSGAAQVTGKVDTALVFIPQAEKGQPEGVASLGPDGKVPEGQLPEMDISKALAGAELKDQPVDNDGVVITDSAAESVPKRVLWSRIKAALKGYFDALYAAKSHSHAWGAITGKPETFPPAAHKHSAADVSAGTLGGQVQANAGAAAALGTAQVRNIRAGTADLTAGSSSLASGEIYLVYE